MSDDTLQILVDTLTLAGTLQTTILLFWLRRFMRGHI